MCIESEDTQLRSELPGAQEEYSRWCAYLQERQLPGRHHSVKWRLHFAQWLRVLQPSLEGLWATLVDVCQVGIAKNCVGNMEVIVMFLLRGKMLSSGTRVFEISQTMGFFFSLFFFVFLHATQSSTYLVNPSIHHSHHSIIYIHYLTLTHSHTHTLTHSIPSIKPIDHSRGFSFLLFF